MKTAMSPSEPVTLFIGTYGYGVTQDLINKRGEDLQDSFRFMFFDNPFIQLGGVPNGFVMGYEDWTHARHVTHLNGCRKHRISLLKVELNSDTLVRLQSEGHIKNVVETGKRIWQVNPFEVLKAVGSAVTFSVLAPTGYPAVSLDEFKLPEPLVVELRSARSDCLQSLFVELLVNQAAYTELFARHSVNFAEFFKKLAETVRRLSNEELEVLVDLI